MPVFRRHVPTYLPRLLGSRGRDPQVGLAVLHEIAAMVEQIDLAVYGDFEPLARRRMAARDLKDWPVMAVALMFNAPIWTEDRDFFGSGVATWTTDRVEQYLKDRE